MSTLRELLPIAGLTFSLALAFVPSAATLADAQTAPGRQVPGAAPPTPGQAERPVILVDLGHGQTFFRTEPGRETPIQVMYRNMAGYLGAELRMTTEPLSKETLKGVRMLLLFAHAPWTLPWTTLPTTRGFRLPRAVGPHHYFRFYRFFTRPTPCGTG